MTGVRMSAGREEEMGRQLPAGVWVGEGMRREITSSTLREIVFCKQRVLC